MDRDGATFDTILNEIRTTFTSVKAIPVTLPIKDETGLVGVIDLVSGRAIHYSGEYNSDMHFSEIPAELQQQTAQAREDMISTLAELSPKIEELYLEDIEPAADIIKDEIRKYVLSCQLCPVLAGSAKYNVGLQQVVDATIDYLPTPIEKETTFATDTASGNEHKVTVIDNYFSAIVFKITISQNAELLYLKIKSGKLSINDEVKNTRTGKTFKVKRLLRIYSAKVTAMQVAYAGDIVGVIGPKNTTTGDTLCTPSKSLMFEQIVFPDPMVSLAIEPHLSRERDKLEESLTKIAKEDPTIHFHKNPHTAQLILSGMGELHLEINIHRLEQEFNLKVCYGEPRINYKETFLNRMDLTGSFERQAGPNLLKAEVDFSITPTPLDSDTLTVECDLPSVSNSWQRQVTKAFYDGLHNGGNWSFPLYFASITVHAIRGDKDHTTDGSLAGAVMDGIQQAINTGTHLLEPVMALDVFSPTSTCETIRTYLLNHRSFSIETSDLPNGKHLSCLIPLVETLKLGKELPKVSAGRAAFTMRPHSFQALPPHLLKTVKPL